MNVSPATIGSLAVFLLAPCAGAADLPSNGPAGPAYCRFVPERSDDFAWENDVVAFRTYGPALRSAKEDSGIDCWLKRTPTPVIDRWYADHAKGISYHEDRGEGYDPYHVGSSRGCGGLGLWRDGRLVTSDTFTAWRIIEQGGQRCVFELDYVYPSTDGMPPVAETKRITLEAGRPFFQVEARFTQHGKPAAGLPVAIGVTTHDGKAAAKLDPEGRWASCWEVIDGQGLGTGALLGAGYTGEAREVRSSEPDAGHALLITRTNEAGIVTYEAGYGWQKAGRASSAAGWAGTVSQRSKELLP